MNEYQRKAIEKAIQAPAGATQAIMKEAGYWDVGKGGGERVFEVQLSRQLTQYATVEVRADNIEDAKTLAKERALEEDDWWDNEFPDHDAEDLKIDVINEIEE